MKQEEQSQIEAYLRKACSKGLNVEEEREEMMQEMWLCLLESGVLESEILEDGKLSEKVRKKIANELPNKRERLFYRHRKREKQEPKESNLLVNVEDENVSTAKPKAKHHSNEHYQYAVQERSARSTSYENEHHNYVDEFRLNLPFVAEKLTQTQTDVVDYLIQDYATNEREGDGETKRDYVMRKAGVNYETYKQEKAIIKLHFQSNGYRSAAHSSVNADSFTPSPPIFSPAQPSVRSTQERTTNKDNPSYLKNITSAACVTANSNGDSSLRYGGTKPEKSEEFRNNNKACEWLEKSGLLKQFKTLEDVGEFLNWLNVETWMKGKNETYENGIPYKPENTKAIFLMDSGCCGREKVQFLCNEPPTSFFCWCCGKAKAYSHYPNSLAGFLLSVIERHVMSKVTELLLPIEVLKKRLEGWKAVKKAEAVRG